MLSDPRPLNLSRVASLWRSRPLTSDSGNLLQLLGFLGTEGTSYDGDDFYARLAPACFAVFFLGLPRASLLRLALLLRVPRPPALGPLLCALLARRA